jgi:hypothetical protein
MSPSSSFLGRFRCAGRSGATPTEIGRGSAFVDFCEWLGTQVVHPKLRFLAHVDEAGLTQDSQVSRGLRDTLPNASLRTLEGEWHGVAPEVLAPVLTEFFSPDNGV